MIKLPGWTFKDLGPNGASFDEKAHPKFCLHTTEGGSLAGAEGAFAKYPPHLGISYEEKLKRQYVSLDMHSYAFLAGESDDEYVIQVEIVGYAGQTHLWSEAKNAWIGDVLAEVLPYVKVPNKAAPQGFHGSGEGIKPYIASKDSPIRFKNQTEFRNFSGWFGHQHAPSPDHHWDPGKINIAQILTAAYGATTTPAPKPPQPQPVPSGNPTKEQVMSLPTVKQGSSGQYVRNLQGLLVANQESSVSNANAFVDGAFGSGTTSVLKAYQSKVGLAADGICGPNTWTKLTGVS